ncbi:hypothetical protein PM082_007143 [Marasmius tenuissimus]|nr:hypothetical protein PM082_007143 [Marasmius tenuissimus]
MTLFRHSRATQDFGAVIGCVISMSDRNALPTGTPDSPHSGNDIGEFVLSRPPSATSDSLSRTINLPHPAKDTFPPHMHSRVDQGLRFHARLPRHLVHQPSHLIQHNLILSMKGAVHSQATTPTKHSRATILGEAHRPSQ